MDVAVYFSDFQTHGHEFKKQVKKTIISSIMYTHSHFMHLLLYWQTIYMMYTTNKVLGIKL